MLSKVFSYGVFGIETYPVEIEVDILGGIPAVNIVGLADIAIKESKVRVKSAIMNSGFQWPGEKIAINLAPSHIKKEGPGFDLAIALGILAATGQINTQNLSQYCILGELSLNGTVRPCKGILPISMALTKSSIKNVLVPAQNIKEAAVVETINAWPIHSLRSAVEFLNDPDQLPPEKLNLDVLFKHNACYQVDFSEIKGQFSAKRAIEIAVAGGHNIATSWTQCYQKLAALADR
jgi:magnesium chelatase family protein